MSVSNKGKSGVPINLGGIGPKPPDEFKPGMVLKEWLPKPTIRDNWDKSINNLQRCETCMHYANMRCRRHSPHGQEGWPAVFPTDWCGDHKMSKSTMAERA